MAAAPIPVQLWHGDETTRLAKIFADGQMGYDGRVAFSGWNSKLGGVILTREIQTVSGPVQLEHRDVVEVDTSAGAVAVTCEPGARVDTWHEISDPNGTWGTNNVTLSADVTIDGAASPFTLNLAHARAVLVREASNWRINIGRVKTHADVVASWFEDTIGDIGTTPIVRPDGEAFIPTKALVHERVVTTNLAAGTPTDIAPTALAGGSIYNYMIHDTSTGGIDEVRNGTLSEIIVAATPALRLESLTTLAEITVDFIGVPA